MNELFGKAFFAMLSIPTFILMILLATIFPPEPRFENVDDCHIWASEKAAKVCSNLWDDANKTEYFDFERCYEENYSDYYKMALKEYHNPPEIKGSFFDKIERSYFGLPIFMWMGIGSLFTLYRLFSGDKKWYWFLPDKVWLNEPTYDLYPED